MFASHSGPHVKHLFFADNSLIFGEASIEGLGQITHILNEYELCPRQQINYTKSMLFFSVNVRYEVRSTLENVLGVYNTNDPEKYLGLPVVVGRNKKRTPSVGANQGLGQQMPFTRW